MSILSGQALQDIDQGASSYRRRDRRHRLFSGTTGTGGGKRLKVLEQIK